MKKCRNHKRLRLIKMVKKAGPLVFHIGALKVDMIEITKELIV